MIKYNLILIFNKIHNKILMCKRKKHPHKGKYNLIGGKIKFRENGLKAAYREMFEETSITNKDIKLYHLMDIKYYQSEYSLDVYAGVLENDVTVSGDENELFWINQDENFHDNNIYAGNGLIVHILSAFENWLEKEKKQEKK